MDPQAGSAIGGHAADARSLDRLRLAATRDPAGAVRQVATQFEALFMQMVLKSMREAGPKSGLLSSPDHEMYTGMLDEQLAQKVAQGGTGLAGVIARQLSRNLPQATPEGGAGPAAGPAPGAPQRLPGEAVAAAAAPAALLQALRAAATVRGGK